MRVMRRATEAQRHGVVRRKCGFLAALGMTIAFLSAPAAAQEKAYLAPEESAARAKALIQRAIEAMGGDAYLKARDVYCEGRFAQFGSTGQLSGYERVYDYVMFPDKNRTEFSKKRNIIYVNNGDKAWSLDRGGVEDLPDQRGKDYLESLLTDLHYLFRFRLQEEGMVFRYTGRDTVDLKPVDWVELTDRDRRVIRIAFAQNTGLPVRASYVTRDPETRVRTEETDYFSNYHNMGGIETALRIWKETNGRMTYQVFWDKCSYNTGVSEAHFTREALEQLWAKLKK
jgi:outer membrane lipoprotein-sorting protein